MWPGRRGRWFHPHPHPHPHPHLILNLCSRKSLAGNYTPRKTACRLFAYVTNAISLSKLLTTSYFTF